MNQCDHGHETRGEIRILPTGGGGNMHVCRAHFDHEIAYRQRRKRELRGGDEWWLPSWESLQVAYPAEGAASS